MWRALVLGVVGLLAGCTSNRAVVTTGSLLGEMTDLAAMAEYPSPDYTCRQFSSYDRAAKSPGENWFANGDRGHFLRKETNQGREEHVLMDAAGPGAIVRIWSANPVGTLRVYIDGNETPALAVETEPFLHGKVDGVPVPIVGIRGRGCNSYLPIPYARHCKVTCDEGGFYYHVNYRTYGSETQVVNFTSEDLDTWSNAIAETAARLASPRKTTSPPGDAESLRYEARIPANESMTLLQWAGSKAVCDFVARVEADDQVGALRQTVLRMTFDDEQTVEVPIGDFFGTAPGVNAYESLPAGMTGDGEMWCRWTMPFAQSAKIEVENTSAQEVVITGSAATVPYHWTDRSMHFHAGWRTAFDVPTRPHVDWNYLAVTGRGVFAGASLAIANPVNNWWGEGDEKIYVDGETFPSHFGTGTEDYFGYAWGSNEVFEHAYHNQPRADGPGNFGNSNVNRWHVIDRIPFRENFKFDMELMHHHDATSVSQSAMTVWYGRPGATDGFEPLTKADLKLTELQRHASPKTRGAIEGEAMAVLEKVGTVGPQGNGGCSGESHLWWSAGAKPGDRIVLGFDVERAGRYRVRAAFLMAGDYAIVQLYVNDAKAGEPIDLYSATIKPADEIMLGMFDLTAGQNRLAIEIVGANAKAAKSYMASLDYLLLERVD